MVDAYEVDRDLIDFRVGQAIEAKRKEMGLTLAQAGELLKPWGWKVSSSLWHSIEGGMRKIGLAEVWLIEQALDIDISALRKDILDDPQQPMNVPKLIFDGRFKHGIRK